MGFYSYCVLKGSSWLLENPVTTVPLTRACVITFKPKSPWNWTDNKT